MKIMFTSLVLQSFSTTKLKTKTYVGGITLGSKFCHF